MITDQIGLHSVLLALQIAIHNTCHKIYCTIAPLLTDTSQYRHFYIMDISLGSSMPIIYIYRYLYNKDTSVLQTPGSVPSVSILKMFADLTMTFLLTGDLSSLPICCLYDRVCIAGSNRQNIYSSMSSHAI